MPWFLRKSHDDSGYARPGTLLTTAAGRKAAEDEGRQNLHQLLASWHTEIWSRTIEYAGTPDLADRIPLHEYKGAHTVYVPAAMAGGESASARGKILYGASEMTPITAGKALKRRLFDIDGKFALSHAPEDLLITVTAHECMHCVQDMILPMPPAASLSYLQCLEGVAILAETFVSLEMAAARDSASGGNLAARLIGEKLGLACTHLPLKGERGMGLPLDDSSSIAATKAEIIDMEIPIPFSAEQRAIMKSSRDYVIRNYLKIAASGKYAGYVRGHIAHAIGLVKCMQALQKGACRDDLLRSPFQNFEEPDKYLERLKEEAQKRSPDCV